MEHDAPGVPGGGSAGPRRVTGRLIDIRLDEAGLPVPTAETEQERRVAVYDLLEANRFVLPGRPEAGPFRLGLALREGRLVFRVEDEGGGSAAEFHLSLSPLRQIIKDYFQICESYHAAVKNLPPSRIEAIDMGRRGIHDEGSRILMERLAGKVETDHATARRLFTLICVLHARG